MKHPLSLEGRVAVVVGGTSGIGRAISLGLADAGADVVSTGRRSEQVDEVAAAIEARGRRTLRQPADQTDRAQIEALLDACVRAFGKVDILCNCAGKIKRTPTLTVSEAEWQDIVDTNLTGMLRCCQVFGKHMLDRGYGRIINIASAEQLCRAQRSGGVRREQVRRAVAHTIARRGVVAARRAGKRHRPGCIPHRVERCAARRFAAWTGAAHAHADGPLWQDRGTGRRGHLSRQRRSVVHQRSHDRGGRGLSRQRRQPVSPGRSRIID